MAKESVKKHTTCKQKREGPREKYQLANAKTHCEALVGMYCDDGDE